MSQDLSAPTSFSQELFSPKKNSGRVVLRELLIESRMSLWVPIGPPQTHANQPCQPYFPVEIKGLESALHLPRVKVLFIFPEDLMAYWSKIQGLLLNIAKVLNFEELDFVALFGSEAIWAEIDLLKKLCRRTAAKKVVSFGVNCVEFGNANSEKAIAMTAENKYKIKIISTRSLNKIWENPIQKKQVWNDVSSLLF